MSYQETKDGSLTYISPIYNAAFHSRHGAIRESKHVFIQHGLAEKLENNTKKLHVFEMGFGSGLNVLLSILYSLKKENKTEISLDTIEKHPLPWDKAKKLDYCSHLTDFKDCQSIFESIHSSTWNEKTLISPGFQLTKIKGDLLTTSLPKEAYDLIYYDAFAPSSQSELWSIQACQLIYDLLKRDGLMTTYCAQGQFKRNLKSVGFLVEALPGPPGKREMTRAIKA
jgi:tRNA U34 5-methylaminomethyl-2-thiouridine-forming methyltransferase MnmC